MKKKFWAFLVVLLVISVLFYTSPGEFVQRRPGGGRIEAQVIFYSLGLMFLLSYFYEERSFIFKFLFGFVFI